MEGTTQLCNNVLRNRIIALLKRAQVVSGDPDDPLAACLRVAGQAGVRIGTAADDDRPQKSRYQLAVDVDGFNLMRPRRSAGRIASAWSGWVDTCCADR